MQDVFNFKTLFQKFNVTVYTLYNSIQPDR